MHRIDTQHAAALPRCVTRDHTDQGIRRRLLRAHWTVLGLALASLSSGCAVRHALINRVDDAVAANDEVCASDPDVELVGAAMPFGLKLIESLLADSPQHRGLLLAASRGFTQYADAYVEIPADELEEHDVAGACKGRGAHATCICARAITWSTPAPKTLLRAPTFDRPSISSSQPFLGRRRP